MRRRLAAETRQAMRRAVGLPVVWGRDDCALWQGDIELAARNYDPCADFRGRYRTMRGAKRILGPGGLPAALRKAARRHGWRRIDPREARIGDIGLIATGGGTAVVRMLHKGEWIGRSDGGWSMVPTALVRVAWSVA